MNFKQSTSLTITESVKFYGFKYNFKTENKVSGTKRYICNKKGCYASVTVLEDKIVKINGVLVKTYKVNSRHVEQSHNVECHDERQTQMLSNRQRRTQLTITGNRLYDLNSLKQGCTAIVFILFMVVYAFYFKYQ
jgi:hypothetical protein